MGVPFEALLPYGVIIAMFGITGGGLSLVKYYSNGGKRARWNTDAWDRQSTTVMDRDLRITGSLRGQSGNTEAPKGFEVSNPWRLEKRMY
ncbi:hypothetical protein Egran_00285 [Elaphomyces granulatus]|uniref:NADH dehydrogenase [ubiquinone] 1 alpha subcomplex subunit 1 n=1 Tax=Elaphomyces granulatus TaxID=519963 RepID=A0A232M6B0_9EURO|nr:hypothetical protein Egran_00285 [Elaphomyces granulatus]